MKKITFTLVFLFSFLLLKAENLNFTSGPDSTCSVTIEVDTLTGNYCFEAIATGTPPFTYSWNDGTTQSTTCANPMIQEYTVTVIDANGCVATAVFTLPPPCDVFVYVAGSPNTFQFLQAAASGIAPFTYQWSTGELSSSINPSVSGTYCVTVTDVTGCSAADCITYTVSNTLCSVELLEIQNGACLQAEPMGIAPYTYLWDSGLTTPTVCATGSIDSMCVTVTDATGCESYACGVLGIINNCSVDIYSSAVANGVEVGANPVGTSPFQYVWSTGELTQTIVATQAGTYTVTITDATGCNAFNEISLGCGNTPVGNMFVYIDFDSTGTSGVFNAVVSGGNGGYTYLWDTGETTSSITDLSGNTYHCVTVTDVLGCTAQGCSHFCWSYISILGNVLTSNGNGTAPYTYLWSTGEVTQNITAPSTGMYCVTVTDSNGCEDSQCAQYFVNDNIEGFVVLDSVFATGTVYSARVYLIQHDSVAGTLTAIDSIDVTGQSTPIGSPNIFYSFIGLATGDYLVKAALLPGSTNYENFLPTYFDTTLYWSNAQTIPVPYNAGNAFFDIHMVAGTNPGGPGFIGGLVSEGANFTAGGQVETRGEGDPLENVNVLLLTENDVPITHTLTDVNGEYSFPDLPYGTYKVVVEILGKEPGIKMVTISATIPSANIDFSVNESFVTGIDDVLNGASIKVFPNPVDDFVFLQVEMKENVKLEVSVINMLGEVMFAEQKNINSGIETLQVNMENIPTGIYFLTLSDGREMISQKLIKN